MNGPTTTPCGECDICQGIASGDDVDVIEIDGASNRGIDEIRQLRSNVNVRPSRARFKIYIIDEVHMLTTPAFNALLKTLEEPPEHVKFIFCTTEADKIPITVLSRCQRFDFAPIETQVDRRAACSRSARAKESTAEPEALQIVARRAAGSMRDSQSLLEQLLSFGGQRITVADVHALLGTAHSGRLAVAGAVHRAARRGRGAGARSKRRSAKGVDLGQFAEQLLGYFRDCLAALVGCPAELLLHTAPPNYAQVKQLGQQLGLETLLAMAQILDQTLVPDAAEHARANARRSRARSALQAGRPGCTAGADGAAAGRHAGESAQSRSTPTGASRSSPPASPGARNRNVRAKL